MSSSINPQALLLNPLEEIDCFYSHLLASHQYQSSDYSIDLTQQFQSVLLSNEIYSQVFNFFT